MELYLMTQNLIKLQLSGKLKGLFEVLFYRLVRWVVLEGGRSSGKSWALAACIIVICSLSKWFVVCCRDYENSIEYSIQKLLKDTVYRLRLNWLWKITQTKMTCSLTGSEITFFGLVDNPDKIKSLEGCDLCVIEEAAKIPEFVWKILIPTIRKPGSIIALIFNPDWEFDPTYKRFVTDRNLLKDEGLFYRHINFLDNPWVSQSTINEANRERLRDFDEYEHIWLGKPRKNSKFQIFRGVWSVLEFDSQQFKEDIYSSSNKGKPKYYNGVAWGISQRPTAAVRLCEWGGDLYVEHCADGVEELDGMVSVIESIPKSNTYYCSPEQPATRLNINKRLGKSSGIKLQASEKGQDDVIDAITFLRGAYNSIYIHPRCEGVIQNFDRYWWKTDEKSGEILDEPIDKNNQYFHAMRHALHVPMGIGR